MKLLPNLTGLRFVLAFLVVIFHIPQFCQNRGFPYYNNLSIFNKGEEAVYMFFSLSGFLIIRQLYIEKSVSSSVNLKKFFKKNSKDISIVLFSINLWISILQIYFTLIGI